MRWESAGEGDFTIDAIERAQRGLGPGRAADHGFFARQDARDKGQIALAVLHGGAAVAHYVTKSNVTKVDAINHDH